MLKVAQIIRQVTASVSNIWDFPSDIQAIVVDSYVQGLSYTYRRSPHFWFLKSSVKISYRPHKQSLPGSCKFRTLWDQQLMFELNSVLFRVCAASAGTRFDCEGT